MDGVGVFESISVAVVRAVVAGPPADGTLYRAATEEGQGDLDWERSGVGGVRPKSVIAFYLLAFLASSGQMGMICTSSNPKPSQEIVEQGPDNSLPEQRCREGGNETEKGDNGDEGDVHPIDMLVPILQRYWLFRNMLSLLLHCSIFHSRRHVLREIRNLCLQKFQAKNQKTPSKNKIERGTGEKTFYQL